jgi:mRNA-degrading endonuclease toxin of MazEF toxin-antitoxin module
MPTLIPGEVWVVILGAFHVQQIQTISTVKLERRLGALSVQEIDRVREALAERLKLRNFTTT